MIHPDKAFRRTVAIVAILNLAYFAVEFIVALRIGSVSLFADSIDFVEDAAVNILIFLAVSWSLARRAQLGMGLSFVLLAPAAAFLWALWGKFTDPFPPEPFSLGLTGLGALAVNLLCAFLLVRWRSHSGSLTKAAFYSARNDAFANIAIVGAGLTTMIWSSIWPDLIVGVGIALVNLDAAREVWTAAREEQLSTKPEP